MALYLAGISVVVLLCKHMYVRVAIAVLDPYAGRSGLFFMYCPLPAILFEKLGKKFFPLHFLFMLEVLAPAVLISREMSVSMVAPGVSQRSGTLERTAEGELCHAVPLFVEQAGNGLRPSGP